MKIKALSLHQPWASLIAIKVKQKETRSWYTSYRGDLIICSTAKRTKEMFKSYSIISKDIDLPPWDEQNFPTGVAIASCNITDCLKMNKKLIEEQSFEETICGDWEVNRFAWILSDILAIPSRFEVKGMQGLFSIEVPENIAFKSAVK